MERDYKLIGAPCAVRGPYTFYKALKYTKNGVTNILTINEFFFVKLWSDSDFISIGELRLLWEDQSCDKALASLRLYILPENTPDGRVADIHGEDEVLAITEKVIIRLEDLLTWITDASDWHWGLSSIWTKQTSANNCNTNVTSTAADVIKTEERNIDGHHEAAIQAERSKINGSMNEVGCQSANIRQNKSNSLEDCSAIDYSDVLKEKVQLDVKNWETRTGVLVLSYSRYCRYRALLRRLEGVHNDWLRDDLITALGGFATTYRTTKILFCRDTFDYPELEGHELLCNHLAPKLRSRIPKKKKTLYPSPDVSESDVSSDYGTEDDERSSSASSCSSSTNSNNSLAARFTSNYETGIKRADGRKFPSNQVPTAQQAFTQNLYAFMKARLTPIGRLPLIGNKEINLYEFYNKVKLLGSYASVTNNKLWKYVFEELGGDRGDPSMATLMRKYYEKFLLPYEQHMLQQLKHSSANQSTSTGAGNVIKSQCSPSSTLNADYRYQADRRKVVTTIRPVPGGVRFMDGSRKSGAVVATSVTAQMVMMKPSSLQSAVSTGGKENIPLSRKLLSGGSTNNSAGAEVVIDLCAEEEGSSKTTPPRKCSSTEPEVIDLCEESPIRRSVPSIAATLLPRKRKLDILREGGLEVTPVASLSSGGGFGSATISRRLPPASVAITAIKSGETSLEPVNPKKMQKTRSGRVSNHVLDMRMMRNVSAAVDDSDDDDDDDEDSIVKKFSPNLGPNIEISLVANDAPVSSTDEIGIGANTTRRDEKKRKSIPLPIPALRKISTGELSVQNLTDNNEILYKPKVTLSSRKTCSDVTLTKAPSKSSVITTSAASAGGAHTMKDRQTQPVIQHVNPSLYLAAFYNSIFPETVADTFISAHDEPGSNNPYQIQLTQQQINYVKGAFMHHQPNQEIELDNATDAFAQKFTSMLKNGSVSIVENYEKILPD